MSSVIDHILASIHVYKQCYAEQPGVLIIDREQVVYFEPAPFLPNSFSKGMPISALANTVTVQVLKTGKRIIEERDASHFGVSYISVATPIVENGEVVGVLSIITPNTRIDLLRQGATDLSSVIEQMAAATQQMTSSATLISEQLADQAGESNTLVERLAKASSVLTMVKELAERSQLLGLNAAIEAARAGEHGLGFNVVATEIRKMADYSKNAVMEITNQFRLMEANINEVNKTISEISGISHGFSASMQELNSAFDHISGISQKLLDSASV
ncbi:methyl-accepting chemotaxis protein [Paenibacillus kobensis]|uniref:methyl-accepting chemotaxis protein n=1 Tax=Paenibacillus kobensis TaxID=59841 RepID=UPI000FDB67D0|nr:methyl-accepting chemotaxis protein [Paenibacillus kobensis]